jgi:hypothetical protein
VPTPEFTGPPNDVQRPNAELTLLDITAARVFTFQQTASEDAQTCVRLIDLHSLSDAQWRVYQVARPSWGTALCMCVCACAFESAVWVWVWVRGWWVCARAALPLQQDLEGARHRRCGGVLGIEAS